MSKHALVSQASWKPVAKVAAAWLAAGGSTAILAGLAALTDTVDGQTVVGAVVAGVAAGVAGYLKRAHTVEA